MARKPSTNIILAFLLVYLLIVGTLFALFRAGLARDTRLENDDLEVRIEQLRAEVENREALFSATVQELQEEAAGTSFEETYREVLAQVADLRDELAAMEDQATIERRARMAAERDRNDVYSQLQSVSLQLERNRINLASCLEELGS